MQSALIGFLVSRLFPTPLNAQEIVLVQTTAVATATVRAPAKLGLFPCMSSPILDALGRRFCRNHSCLKLDP